MSRIAVQFLVTGFGGIGLAGACLVALLGCAEPPQQRTFSQFLVDPIAREATLARCNGDREASAADLECSNARRAAAAMAAQAEAERRAKLEAESERKRAEARARVAAQQEADRKAAEAARQAAEAAYETEFLYGGSKTFTAEPLPTDGEPEPAPPRDRIKPEPRVVQPGPDAALPGQSTSDTDPIRVHRQDELAHLPRAGSP